MEGRGTVMIVDDDVDLLDELSEMLVANDYQPVSCAVAGAATRIAAENRPDVVLIDILMPGLNGLQVVEKLRSDPGSARIPIVMMSGRCTSSEGEALVRINRLAGFVRKPIDPVELIDVLERIVG